MLIIDGCERELYVMGVALGSEAAAFLVSDREARTCVCPEARCLPCCLTLRQRRLAVLLRGNTNAASLRLLVQLFSFATMYVFYSTDRITVATVAALRIGAPGQRVAFDVVCAVLCCEWI